MTKPSRRGKVPSRGRAHLRRLRDATEVDVARTSPDELAGLPEGFWKGARPIAPVPKHAISLRVDEDVLAWFRAMGPRYQSRMNAVLRSYVAHMRGRRGPRGRRGAA